MCIVYIAYKPRDDNDKLNNLITVMRRMFHCSFYILVEIYFS